MYTLVHVDDAVKGSGSTCVFLNGMTRRKIFFVETWHAFLALTTLLFSIFIVVVERHE